MSSSTDQSVVPKKYLVPFILVTSLFALWGFANNVTDPLVAAFRDIFVINNAQSSWVQMAFYGGYATMAIPAAIFIRKYSYKRGILVGLILYATGAFISVPAAALANFNLFVFGLYILTFGLAFLETTANPYILSMGPRETATRRLNLAQAFNPIGSLVGIFVASTVILGNINVEDFRNDVGAYHAEAFPGEETQKKADVLPILEAKQRDLKRDPAVAEYIGKLDAKLDNPVGTALKDYKDGVIASYDGMTHSEMQKKDLKIVSLPYTVIGFILIIVLITFMIIKMPDTSEAGEKNDHQLHFGATLKRLLKNKNYIGGVIAQTFYVGAQIMVWTYITQYAENELGIDKATAQRHQLLALGIFLSSRFICTFFLKYLSPGKLLSALSFAAVACTLGAIYMEGMPGLYSLIAISACMSLMFPTIYGLALDGVGQDAKLGSAGLIFAIVGGAVMPKLQGGLIDMDTVMGVSGTRGSFYLPVLCFIVIAIYGWYANRNNISRQRLAGGEGYTV